MSACLGKIKLENFAMFLLLSSGVEYSIKTNKKGRFALLYLLQVLIKYCRKVSLKEKFIFLHIKDIHNHIQCSTALL